MAAYIKHWQIPFVAKDGHEYVIYIHEQDYDDQLETLTAATDPFITQEDNVSDIYVPFRTQTGYIRVIDHDGTLAERVMPYNNLEKYVTLEDTSGKLYWQGFLRTELYTQPWIASTHELSLPVKSILAALEDVYLDISVVNDTSRLVNVLLSAISALNDNAIYDYLIIHDDITPAAQWIYQSIDMRAFFYKTRDNNQSDEQDNLQGISYAEALKAICSLFGLTAREEGKTLYFGRLDVNDQCQAKRYAWSDLSTIANGGWVTPTTIATSTPSVPDVFSVRGSEHECSYATGARNIEISLSIENKTPFDVTLPPTDEDASPVVTISNVANGIVNVQPHDPRDNSIESYVFSQYSGLSYLGGATYQQCLQNCVINNPLFDPQAEGVTTYTGAFPVRWQFRSAQSAMATLKNGMFFNMRYLKAGQSTTSSRCYSISSRIRYVFNPGYLNIDFSCHDFTQGFSASDIDNLYFGTLAEPQRIRLFCRLSIGRYGWTGEDWVYGNTSSFFEIIIDGSTIKSNKTQEMNVEGSSGWFVPIDRELVGVLTFSILDVAESITYPTSTPLFANAHSRIISDLMVTFAEDISPVHSQRGENIYRRTIVQKFVGDINTKLSIGSYNNNNKEYPIFILNDDGEYVQAILYRTPTGENPERPEMHLLDRQVAFYSSIRRTYTLICTTGASLLTDRYDCNGVTTVAIDANHNWSENTQKIKFIEIP